jgi:glycosyltransferase involved in cell wall biosynthesis
MKKFLIIIPFYNVEKYLRNSIESILQQTHSNLDLVLIDDCSTDNSLNIAESYKDLDNVTILQNKKNIGTYQSVNKALDFFKDKEWDYWHFHGSDDMSDLTRLEKILKIFHSNPSIVALKCTCIKTEFGTNNFIIDPKTGQPSIATTEGIAVYDRKIQKYLGYYDNTRFSGDTDMWWRLETFCNVYKPEWKIGESKEVLYLNFDQENDGNITKKYDWHTTRPNYWAKIRNEIQTQMIPNKNFYRDFKI